MQHAFVESAQKLVLLLLLFMQDREFFFDLENGFDFLLLRE